MHAYKRFNENSKIKIFPSLRFEYFLKLLENCEFLIGNSSTAIHEAPYYNIPAIDIGSRQKNRSTNKNLLHVDYKTHSILSAIKTINKSFKIEKTQYSFGDGSSSDMFINLLNSNIFWETNHQKTFQDIAYDE